MLGVWMVNVGGLVQGWHGHMFQPQLGEVNSYRQRIIIDILY